MFRFGFWENKQSTHFDVCSDDRNCVQSAIQIKSAITTCVQCADKERF